MHSNYVLVIAYVIVTMHCVQYPSRNKKKKLTLSLSTYMCIVLEMCKNVLWIKEDGPTSR